MKNYDLVIDLMADKIKQQDGEISVLKWQVDDLKKKLAEAEASPAKQTKTKIEIR